MTKLELILSIVAIVLGLLAIATLFVLIAITLVRRDFMFTHVKTDTIKFGVVGKNKHHSTIHEYEFDEGDLRFEGENIVGPENLSWWEKLLRKYLGIRYLGFLAKVHIFPLQERIFEGVGENRKAIWVWQKNPDGTTKMFDNLWGEIPFDLFIEKTEIEDGLPINSRFRLTFKPLKPKEMIFRLNGKFFEQGVDILEGTLISLLKEEGIRGVTELMKSGDMSVFTDLLNADHEGETFLDWFESHSYYTITEIVMTGWDPADEATRKLLEAKVKAQLEGEAAEIVATFNRKVREEAGKGEEAYMKNIASGEEAKLKAVITALGPDATEEMKTAAVLRYLEGINLPKGITHYVGSGGISLSLKD